MNLRTSDYEPISAPLVLSLMSNGSVKEKLSATIWMMNMQSDVTLPTRFLVCYILTNDRPQIHAIRNTEMLNNINQNETKFGIQN